MLALYFVHLIIERASRYPRVLLIRNSIFAWNDPFSQVRSQMVSQFQISHVHTHDFMHDSRPLLPSSCRLCSRRDKTCPASSGTKNAGCLPSSSLCLSAVRQLYLQWWCCTSMCSLQPRLLLSVRSVIIGWDVCDNARMVLPRFRGLGKGIS